MHQIGYSLVTAQGQELLFWGDAIGQCEGVPDRIALPNGDFVHGARAGDALGDWKLVERWGTWGTANSIAFVDGKILVTRTITPDLVVAERERRLSLGFDYDFGDARGAHHIGTTDADMKGWDEVTMASQAAIALGLPETPISIVTDTGAVNITAQEWQKILLSASQHRQPIWAASFALQAMNPIPVDYNNDIYWQ